MKPQPTQLVKRPINDISCIEEELDDHSSRKSEDKRDPRPAIIPKIKVNKVYDHQSESSDKSVSLELKELKQKIDIISETQRAQQQNINLILNKFEKVYELVQMSL